MAKAPQVDIYSDAQSYLDQNYNPKDETFSGSAVMQDNPYQGELDSIMGVPGAAQAAPAQQPQAQPQAQPQQQGVSFGQGMSNLAGSVGQGLYQGVATAVNPQTWIGLGQDIAQRGAKETAATLMTNPIEQWGNRLNAGNVGLNRFVQNASNTIYNLPGQIGAAYQGTKPDNTNLFALTPEEMAMQTTMGPDHPLRGLYNQVVFAPDQATQQAALQQLRNDPRYLIEMRKLTNSTGEAPFTQMLGENPDMLVGGEALLRGAAGQIGKRTLLEMGKDLAKTAAVEGGANILSSDNQSLQDVIQQGTTGAVAGAGAELLGPTIGKGIQGAKGVYDLAVQNAPIRQLTQGADPTFATGIVGEASEGVTPQAIQQARQATPQQSLDQIYPSQAPLPANDPLGMGRVNATQSGTPAVEVQGQYTPNAPSIYGGAQFSNPPTEAAMAGNIRNMGQQMNQMADQYFAQNPESAVQPANVFQRYLQQAQGDVNTATSMIANDLLESMPPQQRATISVEQWQQQINQFAEQLRQQQLQQLTSYPTNYAQSPTAGADFVGRADAQATQQVMNYPTNYAQSPTLGADTVARYDAQNTLPPQPEPPNPLNYQAAGATQAVNDAIQTYEAELQRLTTAAQQAKAAIEGSVQQPLKGQVTKKTAGQALKKAKAPRRRGKKGPAQGQP